MIEDCPGLLTCTLFLTAPTGYARSWSGSVPKCARNNGQLLSILDKETLYTAAMFFLVIFSDVLRINSRNQDIVPWHWSSYNEYVTSCLSAATDNEYVSNHGFYNDVFTVQDLPYAYTNNYMTLEWCANKCRDDGCKSAVIQDSIKSFCGKENGRYGVSSACQLNINNEYFKEVSESLWAADQPDNARGDQECGALNLEYRFLLNGFSCLEPSCYICRISEHQEPFSCICSLFMVIVVVVVAVLIPIVTISVYSSAAVRNNDRTVGCLYAERQHYIFTMATGSC